ncbi:MAG: hypothetical protein IJ217_03210 [Clostridia bacterium]|nr:hypothetical protein [Clostridia bacterium]
MGVAVIIGFEAGKAVIRTAYNNISKNIMEAQQTKYKNERISHDLALKKARGQAKLSDTVEVMSRINPYSINVLADALRDCGVKTNSDSMDDKTFLTSFFNQMELNYKDVTESATAEEKLTSLTYCTVLKMAASKYVQKVATYTAMNVGQKTPANTADIQFEYDAGGKLMEIYYRNENNIKISLANNYYVDYKGIPDTIENVMRNARTDTKPFDHREDLNSFCEFLEYACCDSFEVGDKPGTLKTKNWYIPIREKCLEEHENIAKSRAEAALAADQAAGIQAKGWMDR